ncbi:MAG TPA: efflux RND transporter periplasmic adaptor subunit [Blastocatellia bacterium]|nr:efflux RND transporter periplasmic adaptor subunit [Blastocatellia bacterium]
MPKKRAIKYLLIALPILALAGLTGFRVYKAVKSNDQLSSAGPGGGRGGPGGGGRVQTVQTDLVATGQIGEKVSLTGSLRAKEQVDVSPRIAGRLVSIVVDTGHAVAKGSLIAQIEDDEIRQQVERSKAAIAVVDATIAQRNAELDNAKAELARKKQLVDAGLLSRIDLDALEMRQRVSESQVELARAQKRQSEAELRELNIRESQTRIYSPISGLVAKRHAHPGAMVNSGIPIVTVVSVAPMVIEAKASERDIARVKRGLPVTITVDSLPGQSFTGRVMRISPLLDSQTRNGLVEIEIPNRDGMLKGEMFARVDLDLGSARETTLLPRDALVYRGDQPGVYVIDSEKAKFITLETGLTQEDKVEVISGLKAGDTVITRGSNLIKDGDRVRVMGKGQPGGQPGDPQRRQAENRGQPDDDRRQPDEKPVPRSDERRADRQASSPIQTPQQVNQQQSDKPWQRKTGQ